MVNRGKLDQRRWQLKWYLSGAIRWQPEIPNGSRIISVVTHYFGGRAFQERYLFASLPWIHSLTMGGLSSGMEM